MRFTEEHEWLRPEEDDEGVVAVGLTEQGVAKLGDMVFVELPEEGAMVTKEEEVAVLEGSDATVEIMAAVDGEIVEINEALAEDPGLINEDPMGNGWLFKMRIEDAADLADLMDEAAYKKFL